MMIWCLPHLAKGPGPDFNTGQRDNSNCGCILGPRPLFEPDSNNQPSLGQSNLGQMEDNFCSGVSQMVSCWVQYLARGHRPKFNNGPGIARIVAAFLPAGVYSSVTLIMAPRQARFRSWSNGRYFCSGAHLWSPGECNI